MRRSALPAGCEPFDSAQSEPEDLCVETISDVESVRAERARILGVLLARLDVLTETGVAAIRAEIPAYAAQHDPAFLEDLRTQVRLVYRTNLTSMLEERAITLDDIAFIRGAAMRRAQMGFALKDYLNAYRVGQQALWDAIVTTAGDTSVGHDAALSLATPLMRFINFQSTEAGQAYVEFQQAAVADADRARRDLLELLLVGELPDQPPLHETALEHRIGLESRMVVVVAVAADPKARSDAAQASSAKIARAVMSDVRTLVVVRRDEIVAIPVLGAGGDPGRVCDQVEELQRRLSADGNALSVGVSTVAAGVPELPRAYEEARLAIETLDGRAGVVALPRVAPFDYLVLRADQTVRRLVDERLRAFLEEDRGKNGGLSETVRAFADADMNLRLAAQRLHVHPNTAQYRLRRIEERTGRNPRRVSDLLDLLVAITLDRSGAAPTDLI
jgi:PucR C-terminal helix-turn-helix domain/GGDEF-like domain